MDLIEAGEMQVAINSPRGSGPRADRAHIGSAAGSAGLLLVTTGAAADGLRLTVRNLQECHRSLRGAA